MTNCSCTATGYEDYIDYYMRHIKMFDHVYFLQDNWATNAWRDLGGIYF